MNDKMLAASGGFNRLKLAKVGADYSHLISKFQEIVQMPTRKLIVRRKGTRWFRQPGPEG